MSTVQESSSNEKNDHSHRHLTPSSSFSPSSHNRNNSSSSVKSHSVHYNRNHYGKNIPSFSEKSQSETTNSKSAQSETTETKSNNVSGGYMKHYFSKSESTQTPDTYTQIENSNSTYKSKPFSDSVADDINESTQLTSESSKDSSEKKPLKTKTTFNPNIIQQAVRTLELSKPSNRNSNPQHYIQVVDDLLTFLQYFKIPEKKSRITLNPQSQASIENLNSNIHQLLQRTGFKKNSVKKVVNGFQHLCKAMSKEKKNINPPLKIINLSPLIRNRMSHSSHREINLEKKLHRLSKESSGYIKDNGFSTRNSYDSSSSSTSTSTSSNSSSSESKNTCSSINNNNSEYSIMTYSLSGGYRKKKTEKQKSTERKKSTLKRIMKHADIKGTSSTDDRIKKVLKIISGKSDLKTKKKVEKAIYQTYKDTIRLFWRRPDIGYELHPLLFKRYHKLAVDYLVPVGLYSPKKIARGAQVEAHTKPFKKKYRPVLRNKFSDYSAQEMSAIVHFLFMIQNRKHNPRSQAQKTSALRLAKLSQGKKKHSKETKDQEKHNKRVNSLNKVINIIELVEKGKNVSDAVLRGYYIYGRRYNIIPQSVKMKKFINQPLKYLIDIRESIEKDIKHLSSKVKVSSPRGSSASKRSSSDKKTKSMSTYLSSETTSGSKSKSKKKSLQKSPSSKSRQRVSSPKSSSQKKEKKVKICRYE